MGWIRVDDSFYDNDKMLAAGTIGRDLYWHGMGYCNRNLTDGLIPRGRATSLVDFSDTAIITSNFGGVDGQDCAPIAVERLLTAGLWHEDGHDCTDCVQPGPRHYVVHDYLKYQPSKEQVEAKAEANRERVRQFKERKSGGNSVTNALANAAVTEQLQHTPNPNPNPSISSLVTKKGGVTFRNARDTASRPICSKHQNGNDDDEACRGCMKKRQWDEANADAIKADELDAKRRAREIGERCPDCNGTNLIDIGDDTVIKCDHKAVTHA
jgi:hypothetical protein